MAFDTVHDVLEGIQEKDVSPRPPRKPFGQAA
jgi:hypothetical protein